MRLHALLDEDLILPRLAARDRAGVLREMAARLESRPGVGFEDSLLGKLMEREEKGSTAIGNGVAVPHCRVKGIASPALLLGLSQEGVAFEAVDGKPSHVFFLLVSPEDNPSAGLRLLAAIAALTRRSSGLASKLLAAPTPAGVLEALRAAEEPNRG